MPIEMLEKIYTYYRHEIQEGLLFSGFVMLGVVVKTIRAVRNGSKLSFAWFFSEAILSFFIAIFAYAVADQFFQLKPFFVYAFCAVLGSLSTVVNKKLEELIESIFDAAKTGFKDLLTALIERFKLTK